MLSITFIVVLAVLAAVYGASTCDSQKNKPSCMTTLEDGVNCSFCTSAAAGTICMKETDAKTLPSSVFACEYQFLFNATSTATTTCDAQKSEKTCMATVEADENCSYCSSAAAGSICMKESDAKTLPSSVFACKYQPAYAAAAPTTCDAQKSEKTCMATVEADENCSYCASAAAGSICMKESDAKTLPSSVFDCKYQPAYAAAAATTCDAQKSEKTCMATVEADENCSYCASAAAGSICMKESDAKTLPSSVFDCKYQPAYAAAAPTTCETQSSKTSCLSFSESGVKCSYCASAAVGNMCLMETDAKSLPASVFSCEYQSF